MQKIHFSKEIFCDCFSSFWKLFVARQRVCPVRELTAYNPVRWSFRFGWCETFLVNETASEFSIRIRTLLKEGRNFIYVKLCKWLSICHPKQHFLYIFITSAASLIFKPKFALNKTIFWNLNYMAINLWTKINQNGRPFQTPGVRQWASKTTHSMR